ncbi:MAG: hypothetical protein WED09_00940 [Homoserinimonas sp.]
MTSELVHAARCGEKTLLHKIDSIHPRYQKVVLATLALSLSAAIAGPAPHLVTALK